MHDFRAKLQNRCRVGGCDFGVDESVLQLPIQTPMAPVPDRLEFLNEVFEPKVLLVIQQTSDDVQCLRRHSFSIISADLQPSGNHEVIFITLLEAPNQHPGFFQLGLRRLNSQAEDTQQGAT